jgi:hypothetical protein
MIKTMSMLSASEEMVFVIDLPAKSIHEGNENKLIETKKHKQYYIKAMLLTVA